MRSVFGLRERGGSGAFPTTDPFQLAGLYERAVFSLDARRTPGSPAAGNTIQDLSANALRTANGSIGNAKIVQDGRGGKALRLHRASAANTAFAQSSANVDLTGDCTMVVEITLDVAPGGTASVFGDRIGSLGEASLRLGSTGNPNALWYESSVAVQETGSAAVPATGVRIWYAWERVNNDGGVYQVRWWRSADGATWVSSGVDDVGLAAATVTPSANPLRVGTDNTNASIDGLVHRARAYQGAAISNPSGATLVADFDPTRDASFSSLSWTSSTTGETWTVTGGGADNSDVLFLPAPSTYGVSRYVHLPATTTDWIGAPDPGVPTDIDVAMLVSLPAFPVAATAYLVSQFATASSDACWALSTDTAGRLTFRVGSAGTSMTALANSAAVPAAAGVPIWVRARYDADTGSGQYLLRYFHAPFTGSTDLPSAWTELSAPGFTGATITPFNSSEPIRVGAISSARSDMSVFRMVVSYTLDTFTAPVADFNPSAGTANSTQTQIVSGGATWTVNRATSGRKTAVVEAAKWLLGTDDYIEVQDSDLLDFGASDSFTVLAVARFFDAAGNYAIVAKSSDIAVASTVQGWHLTGYTQASGVNRINFAVCDDAADRVQTNTPYIGWTHGVVAVVAAELDRSAVNATLSVGGTTTTSGSASAVGSAVNALPLRIGATSATPPAAYGNFELYAVYIWREALTASELAAIAADWGVA